MNPFDHSGMFVKHTSMFGTAARLRTWETVDSCLAQLERMIRTRVPRGGARDPEP